IQYPYQYFIATELVIEKNPTYDELEVVFELVSFVLMIAASFDFETICDFVLSVFFIAHETYFKGKFNIDIEQELGYISESMKNFQNLLEIVIIAQLVLSSISLALTLALFGLEFYKNCNRCHGKRNGNDIKKIDTEIKSSEDFQSYNSSERSRIFI
ncbi:MAG: hypothetical protein MHPSP_003195, partial [Paramarteilia canceri]